MSREPPPPKFERVPEDWWNHITDEDREFLKQLAREGRLPFQSREEVKAEIEAIRKRWEERMRRKGIDPDASNADPKA